MTVDEGKAVQPSAAWFLGVARIVVGYMWFQQTLWKLPPDWGGSGGLRYWVELSGQYAVPWYRTFVNGVVLPHFSLFAPQVWLGETVIAASLFFGIFGRVGGVLCALMSINLYFANSKIPGEWYWAYVFLGLLGGIFATTHAGRHLGADRWIVPRLERLREKRETLGRILLALT